MRCSYDKQFKITAVKLVLDGAMSFAETAKALNIHYNSLYRWVSEYEEYGESAFPDHGTTLHSCQYEIKKLKQDNEDHISIKKACKALGVSRSGYYKYLDHKPSQRDLENAALKEVIKEIFDENKGRYGSIGIGKVLNERGIYALNNLIF